MPVKKKPKKAKPRNPFVLPARQRKGGAHRNKAEKRSKENHNRDFTKEDI